DPEVDAVLVILTPQAMTNPTATALSLAKLAATSPKPILAAWLGGKSMREGVQKLIDAGISAYDTPEQAIRAFMAMVEYDRNIDILYETPKEFPVQFKHDREKTRADFTATHFKTGNLLTEEVSKALLETYGIPTATPYPVETADMAVEMAEKIGYPVALKIHSPDIVHKTDVGGVALNIEDEHMVRQSFDKIILSAKAKMPGARIKGVTVQPMISSKNGVEMIFGIKKDPVFDTVMMAGMGGISAELFNDKSLGFPPLNERLARRMLETLKIWPLLQGFRGRPAANLDKLIEVLIRLSYLAADYPEIVELDINPLLVTPEKTIALDARVLIDNRLTEKYKEQYSHLVLRPYPEKYVKAIKLKDGTNVTLRPIKPEDEPLWMEMLGSCSKETIFSRFRYFFQWASHEVATRYCYIDYDREIAIVAEIEKAGKKRLIGVGRLIADPSHETVEYAVLIIDEYQRKELGSILTDYCLDIAKHWDLRRIVAQTTTDNHRMIAVFQKRDFQITYNDADSTVDVVKELKPRPRSHAHEAFREFD
ncbi:MAG: GNAT family N-acetyltransferase, partial [candidate division Zixibacteria bacterium]|nr:GNAT family N-acetyltransferase [candidate division Zixibacteria bacterium]